MDTSHISRRLVLQAGGAASLAAALGLAAGHPASAATQDQPGGKETEILDLGPAVVQFSLMSGLLVGDTLYIGSRNLDPVRIIAFHVPSGKVTGQTELSNGHSIQTLAADSSGRYLYAGVLQKDAGTKPNLFRWDLTKLSTEATALGYIGDRDVRDISVAPDGRVYAVGGGSPTAPALWEYDPATAQIVSLGIPDPGATLARAVAATDATIFFGAGSTLNGGGSASRACLFAYDHAGKTFKNVTPKEMLVDPSIRDLGIVGDKVLVSSAGSVQNSKVAALSVTDPSSYLVAASEGKTSKNFAELGGKAYFANETGLLAYDPVGNTISVMPYQGPSLGEIWGVDARMGKLLVTSGYGFVAEIDPVTGATKTTDLGEAGAPSDPQSVMGIAAGAGYVYVGGNGVIARHALGSGQVTNLTAPGEAKDAVVVDGVLYTGQYSGQGIWSYDPRSGKPIFQVASFPKEQNRPLDVCWDEVNKLVLVAAQADTEGGGSLWTYDPRTGKKGFFVNPIDKVQLLRAVASREGVAYLGGGNPGLEGTGTVVAFDPVAGKELWRLDAGAGAGISALAVQGKYLYGVTRKGGLFVIDLPKQKVVHRSDISAASHGFAALVTNRGVVYGVSDTSVFRFNPKTFAVTTVVADIDGGWYSGSHINNDEDGYLYTMRGRNLVRIDDHPRK
ncbi:PQQ-binding-like beta-propeller repeat protein [Paenarthrobacter sp. JL.01a]|uniref:outer membrane protein assembly factor BamB family protein n=1 Tax=Paenarthrobacter sp. JL.01a TaxID=2979324 RepID=UPI0021C7927A|nr:PQQ-binding-like beta-propeller repeat protein [Paenarthrobacter sp. JL.01a]UXM91551.1 PQQ-binding-like beta-propeller repeat protein [Paenarthrobacter sp. JL.01a]